MNIDDETFPEYLLTDTPDLDSDIPCCSRASKNLAESLETLPLLDTHANKYLSTRADGQANSARLYTSHNSPSSLKLKSKSCNELHNMPYGKKRYNHVSSKVKEYINTLKEPEKKKLIKYRSMPETWQSTTLVITPLEEETIETIFLRQELHSKEEKLKELICQNETAERLLQENILQNTLLKEKIEAIRIELRQAKEQKSIRNVTDNLNTVEIINKICTPRKASSKKALNSSATSISAIITPSEITFHASDHAILTMTETSNKDARSNHSRDDSYIVRKRPKLQRQYRGYQRISTVDDYSSMDDYRLAPATGGTMHPSYGNQKLEKIFKKRHHLARKRIMKFLRQSLCCGKSDGNHRGDDRPYGKIDSQELPPTSLGSGGEDSAYTSRTDSNG